MPVLPASFRPPSMKIFRPLLLLSLLGASLAAAVAPAMASGSAVERSMQVEEALANSLLHKAPAQVAEIAPGVVLPLWRGRDGKLLAIVASGPADSVGGWRAPLLGSALNLRAVDASPLLTETLRYQFDNGLRADARLSQRSWRLPATCGGVPAAGVNGSCAGGQAALGGVSTAEFGAGFARGRLGMEFSLGLSRPSGLSGPLTAPTLAPFYSGGGVVAGLPLGLLGNTTQVSANSDLALGGLRFEVGASYGQIDTDPALLPSLSGLNEKSLHFGVGHGSITGVVTGRVVTPGAAASGLDLQSWTTVDLGITWRLPWHGAFSVGAQNLWSQGAPPPGANVPGAAARVPYVQYQQDL